jgi:hypothetical protein
MLPGHGGIGSNHFLINDQCLEDCFTATPREKGLYPIGIMPKVCATSMRERRFHHSTSIRFECLLELRF